MRKQNEFSQGIIKDFQVGNGFLNDITYAIDDNTCYITNNETKHTKPFKTGFTVNEKMKSGNV